MYLYVVKINLASMNNKFFIWILYKHTREIFQYSLTAWGTYKEK
jgi:hypothetical protein